MKRDSNIVEFPSTRCGSRSTPESIDEIEEWDAWCEVDYYLLEEKNYPELIRHRKQRSEQFPNDPYAQYYLGEVYVLNGEYEKAIEFLTEHHKKFPENQDYQHTILDALFALGKDESNFDWVEKPVVARLTSQFLTSCYQFLKPKREPRTVSELYHEFVLDWYLAFTEEDLLEALKRDDRFCVTNDDDFAFCTKVTVARKSH